MMLFKNWLGSPSRRQPLIRRKTSATAGDGRVAGARAQRWRALRRLVFFDNYRINPEIFMQPDFPLDDL